jgi:hypothetical protein
MASVNQTRPHCVNQVGKTHSKPLAAWHGMGAARARQGRGMLCVNQPLGGQIKNLIFINPRCNHEDSLTWIWKPEEAIKYSLKCYRWIYKVYSKTHLLVTQSKLWIKWIVYICWIGLSCTRVALSKIPQNNAALISTLVQGILHLSPRTEVLRVLDPGFVGGQCCGPPRLVHQARFRNLVHTILPNGHVSRNKMTKYRH